MCGIFGVVGPWARDQEKIKKATRTLIHRGPDAEGYWFNENNLVAFGHRRLSIVDLSEAGAQPMASEVEVTSNRARWVITYNGEIYNTLELKAQLSRRAWRGHSDTEVLLACFEEKGISWTLDQIEGQYAFALWDHQTKKLLLVRDRLGEKPLYYGWLGGHFTFSSELKPIISLFSQDLELNALALEDYFTRSCIGGDRSVFEGIHKLPAGHFLELDEKALPMAGTSHAGRPQSSIPPKKYWSLKDIKLGAHQASPDDLINQTESLLMKSLAQQMVADVPLGAFLSGGIDSSLIVALMQAQSPGKVKTFTVGFSNKSHNEAESARAVASHLETDHHELYVTEADLLAQVPNLPKVYDEPFADSSQIPTILVSQMAKRQVTVALSGDGGDELFAGYNRHHFAYETWPKIEKIPLAARKILSSSIHSLSPSTWEKVFGRLSKILPVKVSQPSEKIFKLARALNCNSLTEFYHSVSTRSTTCLLAPQGYLFSGRPAEDEILSALHMTLVDAEGYLPDDIMVKVDRASMSQSLETRAPFLNRQLVELAFGLPMDMKIRQGQTKWILRQILKKYVPDRLIDRPKMGFGVPLELWLRGELKDWAWSLIELKTLKEQGILDSQKVHRMWDEHQSGQRLWQNELWDVLMFQAWRQEYGL